ncbi:MAG: ATP/GTP-binding protein [Sediminibacterium sp.]|nr:ATP/GTP-binding protein [Sediminibacterium sp.]
MKRLLQIALSIFLLANAVVAQDRKLTKLWESDSLFKTPESVLLYPKKEFLFVSNIDGNPAEKDGRGSIGIMGTNGKAFRVEWVKGLNAPKGMAIYRDKLYVTDLDEVVMIEVDKSAVGKRYPIPGTQFLNDITVDKKGVLYVSDSRGKRVYKIEKEEVSLFADGLAGPNGLLIQDEGLYILDNGTLWLIDAKKNKKKIAEGMEGGTDGIERVNNEEFIVSSWAGIIYLVKLDGTTTKLLDYRENKINTADIAFDTKTRTLYVPTFYNHKVMAFRLD